MIWRQGGLASPLAGCLLWLMAASVSAECPSEDRLFERLGALDLERASRTARFGEEIPTDLYRAAADRIGEPMVRRAGTRGYGVVLAAVPLRPLWMAVNDEDHHALDPDYIPIQTSEVIGGRARGQERVVFQTFARWGVGRWWVSRIRMNEELYRLSEGGLWEIFWVDEIDGADTESPPIAEVAANTRSLESSHGSWLLIPLTAECTLIEYFTDTEPGGIVRLGQMLLAKRGVVLTLKGLLNLAREHVSEHDVGEFVDPDGMPLGGLTERTGER